MKRLFTIATALMLSYPTFAQVNNGKKILVVTTNKDYILPDTSDHSWGCYFPEVTDFYSKIHPYGFEIADLDFVSAAGGNAPIIYDNPSHYQLTISAGDEQQLKNELKNTLRPDEVNPADYNVIYFAGGISSLVDYPGAQSLGNLAAKIYESGGIVAAVCDGISGLVPIKLSDGKHLMGGKTATTNVYYKQYDLIDIKELLEAEGATVTQSKGVVVDQRVITARNVRPVEVATEMLKLLGIIFPASVEDAAAFANSDFTCYPNPAKNTLNLKTSKAFDKGVIEIFGITGAMLMTAEWKNGEPVNISGLATGQYYLRLNTTGETRTLKFNVTKD